MAKLKPLPRPGAQEPGPVTYPVALAIQALRDGAADEHQQKMALEWIVAEACAKKHFPRHQTQADTEFALGRYFVAEQIVGLFYVDLATLRKVSENVEA